MQNIAKLCVFVKLAFHDKAGLIFKCHGLIKVTNYDINASFQLLPFL